MIETPIPQKRIRVNVSTSVKGIKTWEATIEITAGLELAWQAVLDESSALTAALDAKYPAPTDGK